MTNHNANSAQSSRGPAVPETRPGNGPLFVAAALTARRGKYAEASALLRRSLEAKDCSDAQALDLQARIFAQQGMLLRAESCWTEALRIEPGNAKYADGLAGLRRAHDPFHRVRSSLLLYSAFAIALLGLWFASTAYRHVRQREEQTAGELAKVESSLQDIQASSAEAQHAVGLQLQSVKNDVHQVRADTMASIASLPTSSRVDDQFQRLSAATQSALDHLAADMRQRDSLRATEQASIAAAVKANQDQQAKTAKDLGSQIDQDASAIAALRSDSATRADALSERVDQSTSTLQDQIASLRQDFGRVVWFRWPASHQDSHPAARKTAATTTSATTGQVKE